MPVGVRRPDPEATQTMTDAPLVKLLSPCGREEIEARLCVEATHPLEHTRAEAPLSLEVLVLSEPDPGQRTTPLTGGVGCPSARWTSQDKRAEKLSARY